MGGFARAARWLATGGMVAALAVGSANAQQPVPPVTTAPPPAATTGAATNTPAIATAQPKPRVPPCGESVVQDPKVVAGETPGGAREKLVFTLTESATAASRTVYLWASERVEASTLLAGLCGGAPGTVEVDPPSVELADGAQKITLKLSEIDAEAAPTGYLARQAADGSVYELTRFEVRRPGLPELRVLQADAEGTVHLESLGRLVDLPLVIAETGRGPTGDVTLLLGTFSGPEGDVTTLTLDQRAISLGKGESAPVRVRGELTLPGDWRGQLTASWSGKTKTWPVTLKRETPPTITMDVAPPAVLTYNPFAALALELMPRGLRAWEPVRDLTRWLRGDARVTVDVVNPGRGTARVQGPILSRLVSEEGAGPDEEAEADDAGDGAQAVVTGASAKVALPEPDRAWRDLEAGVHRDTVTVPWPGAVGPWSGTMLVVSEGGALQTEVFTLHVKHGPVLCVFMLMLGTLASYYAHVWTKTGRARNVASTNLARVARRVQALRETAAGFAATLEEALADVRIAMDDDPKYDPKEALQGIAAEAQRVEKARALRDEIAALVAMVDDPAQRADLETAFRELLKTYAAGRRSDLALVGDTGRSVIEEAAEALRQRAQAAAAKAVEALATRLGETLGDGWAARRDAMLARVPPVERQAVADQLDEAQRAWAARAQLGTAPGVAELAPAHEALRRIAEALASALAAVHLGAIAAMTAMPKWFGTGSEHEAAWDAVRAKLAELRAAGRPRDAAAAWGTALARRGADQANVLGTLPGREAQAVAMRAAAQELERVMALDPMGAMTAADALRAELERAVADQSAVTERAPGVPMPAVPPEVRWRPGTLPDEARLLAQRQRNDRNVLLISMAVSVLAGLTSLWYGNDDYGTLADYAAALLWGFGIQEAGRLTLPALMKEQLGFEQTGGSSG